MKNMKVKMMKIIIITFMMLATLAIPSAEAYAADWSASSEIIGNESYILLSTYGDPENLAHILNPTTGVGSVVYEFAKIIGSILTFVSVIMIGINIILARHKTEERTSAMTGFMYVTIGVVILSVALLIYTFLGLLMGNPANEIEDIQVSAPAMIQETVL